MGFSKEAKRAMAFSTKARDLDCSISEADFFDFEVL